jgi:hypothetical protein
MDFMDYSIHAKRLLLFGISQKCSPPNENKCILWAGTNSINSQGYPVKTMHGQSFLVHRIVYALNFNTPLSNRHFHVSHTCHQKTCLNFAHLSYEPAGINSQRNSCVQEHFCHGHGHYPRCFII